VFEEFENPRGPTGAAGFALAQFHRFQTELNGWSDDSTTQVNLGENIVFLNTSG